MVEDPITRRLLVASVPSTCFGYTCMWLQTSTRGLSPSTFPLTFGVVGLFAGLASLGLLRSLPAKVSSPPRHYRRCLIDCWLFVSLCGLGGVFLHLMWSMWNNLASLRMAAMLGGSSILGGNGLLVLVLLMQPLWIGLAIAFGRRFRARCLGRPIESDPLAQPDDLPQVHPDPMNPSVSPGQRRSFNAWLRNRLVPTWVAAGVFGYLGTEVLLPGEQQRSFYPWRGLAMLASALLVWVAMRRVYRRATAASSRKQFKKVVSELFCFVMGGLLAGLFLYGTIRHSGSIGDRWFITLATCFIIFHSTHTGVRGIRAACLSVLENDPDPTAPAAVEKPSPH